MDIKVYPDKLKGEVKAPPSKSVAHRAIICAALAHGKSVIRGISGSKDMDATISCMSTLGADIKRIDDCGDVEITGIFGNVGSQASPVAGPDAALDCIESGSTLRFILPIAGALGRDASFTGRGKLPERPMTPLADEMKRHGVTFMPDGRDSLPFSISGRLTPGIYEIPGNISSQYISGLIFALPLLDGDSEIHIKGKLESASYIALTLQMVREFGIKVRETDYGYEVAGGQSYTAHDVTIEGDYSNAAFWMAANVCGADIKVTGLAEDSAQGDKKAAELMSGGKLTLEDIDSRDIPDIIPIMAVAACATPQTTRFYDAARLRIKESDRLAAMADCLSRLGADVEEKPDELIVHGKSQAGVAPLKGGCEVSGYNDHRVVMSMAIAALICEEPIVIKGAEAVAKSYPDFFEVYKSLGGKIEEVKK